MNTPHDEREDDGRFEEQQQSPAPAAAGSGVPPAHRGTAGWTVAPPTSGAYGGPPLSGPQQVPVWNQGARDPRRKFALLAVLLSMMPGLGQVYIGSYRRGFIHILVVAALITLLANGVGPLAPLAALGLAFFWLYNMIDAGRRATHYNMLLQAEAGAIFPEDIDFSNAGGSRAGGIALIVLGFLFLMNTRYRWDFRWLEEWWPVGFMFLGAYLIYKDLQARKDREANADKRQRGDE